MKNALMHLSEKYWLRKPAVIESVNDLLMSVLTSITPGTETLGMQSSMPLQESPLALITHKNLPFLSIFDSP